MRRTMIGIGSCALLGALAFAPVFAQDQQGGQRQDQDRDRIGGQERDRNLGQTGQSGTLRVGQQAPAFNLFDIKGQVFVLSFVNPTDEKWAKLKDNDEHKKMCERYKDQGIFWLTICPYEGTTGGVTRPGGVNQPGGAMGQQGGELQGIVKMDRQQLLAAVNRLDIDYPILYDEGGKLTKKFGLNHVPHVVIIDAQGKVAYEAPIRFEGERMANLNEFDRALGQAVRTTGSLPAGAPRDQQGTQGQGQQGGGMPGQGQQNRPR